MNLTILFQAIPASASRRFTEFLSSKPEDGTLFADEQYWLRATSKKEILMLTITGMSVHCLQYELAVCYQSSSALMNANDIRAC